MSSLGGLETIPRDHAGCLPKLGFYSAGGKRILLETKIQTHEVQTPLSAEMKKRFIEDTYEQLKSTKHEEPQKQ